MKLSRLFTEETVIGAAEGLELSLRAKVLRDGGEDLALSVTPEARATLRLGAEDGKFIFSHGKGRFFTQGDEAGAAFVDAVAAWLGFEMVPDESTAPRGVIEVS